MLVAFKGDKSVVYSYQGPSGVSWGRHRLGGMGGSVLYVSGSPLHIVTEVTLNLGKYMAVQVLCCIFHCQCGFEVGQKGTCHGVQGGAYPVAFG